MIRGRTLSPWSAIGKPGPTGLGRVALSAPLGDFNSPVGFIAAAAAISIGLVFLIRSGAINGLDDHDVEACESIDDRIERARRLVAEARRTNASSVKMRKLAARLETYQRTRSAMDC